MTCNTLTHQPLEQTILAANLILKQLSFSLLLISVKAKLYDLQQKNGKMLHSHQIDLESVEIVVRSSAWWQRLILEAWHSMRDKTL